MGNINVLLFIQEVSKEAHKQIDDVTPHQFVRTPAGIIQAPGLVLNPQLGSVNEDPTQEAKVQKKGGRGELILNEDEQDEEMPYVSP